MLQSKDYNFRWGNKRKEQMVAKEQKASAIQIENIKFNRRIYNKESHPESSRPAVLFIRVLHTLMLLHPLEVPEKEECSQTLYHKRYWRDWSSFLLCMSADSHYDFSQWGDQITVYTGENSPPLIPFTHSAMWMRPCARKGIQFFWLKKQHCLGSLTELPLHLSR